MCIKQETVIWLFFLYLSFLFAPSVPSPEKKKVWENKNIRQEDNNNPTFSSCCFSCLLVFTDFLGAEMQLQPEEGAVFQSDGGQKCLLCSGVLHLWGGLQWVWNKPDQHVYPPPATTHTHCVPPLTVWVQCSSHTRVKVVWDGEGLQLPHFLPLFWTSVPLPPQLTVKLCLFSNQRSPWRAQHSASPTCVDWWPSTVSAGDVAF